MGAFEKLEKRISSSSCPAVCLPVRMGTTQLPFVKCGTRGFLFRKSVANIQVSLKADKNNEHFTLRPIYIYDISLSHSQNGIKFVQKIKTCVLCSIIYFFFKSYRLWDGSKCDTARQAIHTHTRTHTHTHTRAGTHTHTYTHAHTHAYTHTHARAHMHTRTRTHARTHTQYLTLNCFSMATMVTWTRLNVYVIVHCLSCRIYLTQMMIKEEVPPRNKDLRII